MTNVVTNTSVQLESEFDDVAGNVCFTWTPQGDRLGTVNDIRVIGPENFFSLNGCAICGETGVIFNAFINDVIECDYVTDRVN
ncbi:hypothetical protein EB118_23735 [bacterium]|nr:hypothetical protein [bacterium]NDG33066.1 hypothetical protein [bacterium]